MLGVPLRMANPAGNVMGTRTSICHGSARLGDGAENGNRAGLALPEALASPGWLAQPPGVEPSSLRGQVPMSAWRCVFGTAGVAGGGTLSAAHHRRAHQPRDALADARERVEMKRSCFTETRPVGATQ